MKKEYSYKAFFYSLTGIIMIILFLAISQRCSGQIPKDKQDHLIVGTSIGFMTSTLTINTDKSFVYSMASVTLIAGGKELVYDKWMGKGNPEWKDFGYSVGGAVIGWGIVKIFKMIGNKRTRNYTGMRFNNL